MIAVSAARSAQDFETAAALCRALGEWDATTVEPYGVSREEVLALFHGETSASLAAKYSSADARMLIARWQGSPAGCLAFDTFDDTTMELERFFVDPRYRGKGVGRALMEAVLDEIGKGLRRTVLIHTTFYMTSAISVYEALGFTRCPRFRPTPESVQHTDVFMSRKI